MAVLRIQERPTLTPSQVVLLVLACATLAGSCLLLSAAESAEPVDGAIEWNVQSPLRVLVQLLCLNYRFPTAHAGDVKMYVLGLGAGLASLVLSLALALQTRSADERASEDDLIAVTPGAAPLTRTGEQGKRHVAPLLAAQLMACLYVLWSLASSQWSVAPELAVGGGLLLGVQFLWAFCLALGLGAHGAKLASRAIVAVTGVTVIVALWYYYGRNPTLRAKFPFGNPNFLAACLLPGLLLSVTTIIEHARARNEASGAARAGWIAVSMLVLFGAGWALLLTESRGPMLGLLLGLMAIPFFALPRRGRIACAVCAAFVLIGAWWYLASVQNQPSPTGRSATLRFRLYAWSYAWDLFTEKPFTGHGQGGYVLRADERVGEDVLADPLVFTSRIAHAHSEWLEILADLGSVGLVLIGAALVLTFVAGSDSLTSRVAAPARWPLIGLLASLVALIVSESVGVGLRVSEVPALFFTVLGLVWAIAGGDHARLLARIGEHPAGRAGVGLMGSILGIAVWVLVHADFHDARASWEAGLKLREGAYEEALALADAAVNRLSPQRALENEFRLAEAHMLIARELQSRAIEREARARAQNVEGPDSTVLKLAHADRQLSDEHCRLGSSVLKRLIERAPRYLNHGWLAYWLNAIQADNAASRGETAERELFLTAAAAALERELQRQPFDPAMAVAFARLAWGQVPLESVLTVLARPLRHERLGIGYVRLLAEAAQDSHMRGELDRIIEEARIRLMQGFPAETATPSTQEENAEQAVLWQPWTPEVLRLGAALAFAVHDYAESAELLLPASRAYAKMTDGPHLGAASCFAELAEASFAAHCLQPQPALEAAAQAISLCPSSEQGRALARDVRRRMIDYHLTAGQEEKAYELLRETIGPNLPEETAKRELGRRYAIITDAFLYRTDLSQAVITEDQWVTVRSWIRRATELNPDDARAYLLDAELAFRTGDCSGSAQRVRAALDLGLPPAEALHFLEVTRSTGTTCEPLDALWVELGGPNRPQSATPPQPVEEPPPEDAPIPEGQAPVLPSDAPSPNGVAQPQESPEKPGTGPE